MQDSSISGWLFRAAAATLLMASLCGTALGSDARREQIYRSVINGLEGTEAELGQTFTAEDLDLSGAARLPENMQFDLTGVRWDGLLARWEFQLRCRNPQQCVRFLVSAKAENSAQLRARAGRGQAKEAAHARGSQMLVRGSRPGVPAVEAGQNAKVFWSDAALTMSAQVVCLERGFPGQWIRVRLREGRGRAFWARVEGEGWLVAEPGESQ